MRCVRSFSRGVSELTSTVRLEARFPNRRRSRHSLHGCHHKSNCAFSFGQRLSLRKWLEASPYHFYARYRFPNLNPELCTWDAKSRVPFRDLSVCKARTEEAIAYYYRINEFKNKMQEKPMRVLDLFGGVGVLRPGSGCVKVTHALEISPSAARTIKWVPDTMLLVDSDQRCSVGRIFLIHKLSTSASTLYCVMNRQVERPSQPHGKTPIPELPAPDSVDIITAGFPWYVSPLHPIHSITDKGHTSQSDTLGAQHVQNCQRREIGDVKSRDRDDHVSNTWSSGVRVLLTQTSFILPSRPRGTPLRPSSCRHPLVHRDPLPHTHP